MEKPVILSKETLLPIGVTIALVAPIVGIVFFFAGIQSDIKDLKMQVATVAQKAEATSVLAQSQNGINAAKIELLNNKQTEIDTKFNYISQTLDEIRKKLNILP